MVVPTLVADEALAERLASLDSQTFRDFEAVVVDNSGRGLACKRTAVKIIENKANVGFGSAINQACRASESEFIATLNDDAVAHPGWIEALVGAMDRHPKAGMCASCVRLGDGSKLDSAGMLLCADGSSKQRGHGASPELFDVAGDALFPSGSAALYRRSMLAETGGFDDNFFLYCEDTDLGLRGLWAGWTCRYVAEAKVDHRYSHSAGRVSPLKAYYVERNRGFVAIKNFPLPMLLWSPMAAMARYFWHVVTLFSGRGPAGEFRSQGGSALILAWLTLKAHVAVGAHLPRLIRQRWKIRSEAKISPAEFRRWARRFSISPREVASL